MPYYAQLDEQNRVSAVTETSGEIESPHMVSVDFMDLDLLGATYNVNTGQFTPAPTPPEPRRLTKRAFQDRFPLTANGVSRKYDLMDLFMRDDGYAAALGVSGAALYELRALIVTGLNRLNASAYVDLDLADAANFTGLLLQPSIPGAFRLTVAERETMLNTPLAAGERYTG